LTSRLLGQIQSFRYTAGVFIIDMELFKIGQ
jgi:hypothetical protein